MSRTSTQHGAARIASALLACLMLTVLALPASAARVVDVRVGQHPTFTRVVFELDQMRGYRMARDAEAGVLIVSLDANATPESIASRGMVDRVVVEQAVEGAVVRIHLKGGGANPRDEAGGSWGAVNCCCTTVCRRPIPSLPLATTDWP